MALGLKQFLWGDGDLADDVAAARTVEDERTKLLLEYPSVVARGNRDNVKAALELAEAVAKAETERETNLNTRGAAVATVAGIILPVAAAVAKPVFATPSTWTGFRRNLMEWLFLAALVFVASAMVMAVVMVLRPMRGGRTKNAVGAAVVNVWRQDRGDIALTAAADTQLQVFRLDRLLRAIPTWHYRNRSKARWLRRAWMVLMYGVILIAAAGVLILAELRLPAKGEEDKAVQSEITWSEIRVGIPLTVIVVWFLLRSDLVFARRRSWRPGAEKKERQQAREEAKEIVGLLVPPGELTTLREAVLRYHDDLSRGVANSRTANLMRRLDRLRLSWLAIPWLLLVRVPVLRLGGPPGATASEEQAVALYRQDSGKDPLTARVEVGRLVRQLRPLDAPVDRAAQRRGVPPVSRAQLRKAADALITYYRADRRTDDELREVLVQWAKLEELPARARGTSSRDLLRGGRAARAADGEYEARMEQYVAAWRRWLKWQAEKGPPAGSGGR
jgi:hypothetical protein